MYGKNLEEHDLYLEKEMQRLQLINLKLKKKKCEFRVKSISFVGNVFKANPIRSRSFVILQLLTLNNARHQSTKDSALPESRMVNQTHSFQELFNFELCLLEHELGT